MDGGRGAGGRGGGWTCSNWVEWRVTQSGKLPISSNVFFTECRIRYTSSLHFSGGHLRLAIFRILDEMVGGGGGWGGGVRRGASCVCVCVCVWRVCA